MSSRKLLQQTFSLTIVVLFLAGCSGVPAGPVATPTPACGLECTASTELALDIRITCESGEYTQSVSSWETYGDHGKEGWVTNLEGTRTYEDTGNKYRIVGFIFRYFSESEGRIKVDYQVEVTGGVFGETPQTCGSD